MSTRVGVAVAVATVALAGCGGESQSQKAQKSVCDARADISRQVDELKGLTVATASVDGVRQNLDAIQKDLRQIADARPTLRESRRAEVKAATDKFTSSMADIVQGLTSNLSLSAAGPQLQAAAQSLRTAYADSLGKIDCSSG
jgi:uncharacterized protein YhaN